MSFLRGSIKALIFNCINPGPENLGWTVLFLVLLEPVYQICIIVFPETDRYTLIGLLIPAVFNFSACSGLSGRPDQLL